MWIGIRNDEINSFGAAVADALVEIQLLLPIMNLSL